MLPHDSSEACSIYKHFFDTTTDLVLVADHLGFISNINLPARQLFLDESYDRVTIWDKLGLNCYSHNESENWSTAPTTESTDQVLTYTSHTRIYDINLITLKHFDGSIKGFLVILKDITYLTNRHNELEKRVNERTAELRNSKKMLQAVFQAVGKAVFVVDEDSEIMECNQKAGEIFGCHTENLLNVNICSLFDSADRENAQRLMTIIIENQILNTEFIAIRFDKSSFPAFLTLSVIVLDGKSFWIAIVEDLSEQKNIEQQLKLEKTHAEEANITLRNVLQNIQQEQAEVFAKLSHRIVTDILPALDRIRRAPCPDVRNGYIDFVGELLASLTKGTEAELDLRLLRLSKNELKICKFVQAGFSSKEISATMNLAFDTIQTHRKNIRKKLGLSGSGEVSLYRHLLTLKLP